MEGKEAHLVALLGVGSALGHDYEGGTASGSGHGCDVESFLPALHDPVLGQEVHAAQLIHLDSHKAPKSVRNRGATSAAYLNFLQQASSSSTSSHDHSPEQPANPRQGQKTTAKIKISIFTQKSNLDMCRGDHLTMTRPEEAVAVQSRCIRLGAHQAVPVYQETSSRVQTCAAKPVPASMMRAQSSWQQATEEM